MFKRILIANRGEIALRIIRCCREMDIETVQVYSEADKQSLPVMLATYSVCIGPAKAADSYLKEDSIIEVARKMNCDAIHPGYGFLSERADFVEKVEQHGLIWIGPSAAMIRKMGDKVNAKQTAVKCGLPVVPGSEGSIKDIEDAVRLGIVSFDDMPENISKVLGTNNREIVNTIIIDIIGIRDLFCLLI